MIDINKKEFWDATLEHCTQEERDYILSALSENKGGWIPIEENGKEPEEFQEVLISVNGTKGKKVRSATYWGNGKYHADSGDTWKKDEKGLEAWQPKPEPYKKGE